MQSLDDWAPDMREWTTDMITGSSSSDGLVAGTGGLATSMYIPARDNGQQHPRTPEELQFIDDADMAEAFGGDHNDSEVGTPPPTRKLQSTTIPRLGLPVVQSAHVSSEGTLAQPADVPNGVQKRPTLRCNTRFGEEFRPLLGQGGSTQFPIPLRSKPTAPTSSPALNIQQPDTIEGSARETGSQFDRRMVSRTEHLMHQPRRCEIKPGVQRVLDDVDTAMSKRTASEAPIDLSAIDDRDRFMCAYTGCHRTFPTREGLRHHDDTHEPRKRYRHRCAHCDKAFRYPKDVRRHELTHGYAQYPCFECGTRFKREDHLKRHTSKCGGSTVSGRTQASAGSLRTSGRPRARTSAGAETPYPSSPFESTSPMAYNTRSGLLAPPVPAGSAISSPVSEAAYSPVSSPFVGDNPFFSPPTSYGLQTPTIDRGGQDASAGASPASPCPRMMYRCYSNGT